MSVPTAETLDLPSAIIQEADIIEAHVIMRTKYQTGGRGASPHLQPVSVSIVQDLLVLDEQRMRHKVNNRDADKDVANTRHPASEA
ncbi:hypothetical protein PFICI_14362 [Pestalotiopsis fici W106-1]|uniref:Uncharacterized protein n=1 Tax=Pestalotiopsis fici (strain W106-1 / CGMCC3.15140) TaxID=1229662 RepID=W3WNU5_PESFW|nr:uncharacterized protein PFICI_14362 [Pestalotiopsis fici W106-1]ETS74496.1 hypothetical protein PFICI_14362 [Pestalotiopsis fici W106-1]